MDDGDLSPSREELVHQLYEAAELEHNLMCTYLYAAFSLKEGVEEGLTAAEAEAVARWRRAILKVAIDEMGHLAAVWNITAALGASPRFGRANFPLDPGNLPAGIVVKLAPFNGDVLQHFIHLERPSCSEEPDGAGFESPPYHRFSMGRRLTPMGVQYATVGDFYHRLGKGLEAFAAAIGEDAVFNGDPALQLSQDEVQLRGAKPVRCLKTALEAFDAIVAEGEGAPAESKTSHFQRFIDVREEFNALAKANPSFAPAFPAAHNPVLRPPPKPEGRVWLENEEAIATVDLGNACYGVMMRLMAYAYGLKSPSPEKALAVDLAIELMRAASLYGARAARLPAGPSNPDCNAGLSFTALRDSAPWPHGASAWKFFIERFNELKAAGDVLAACQDRRVVDAARMLDALTARAAKQWQSAAAAEPAPTGKVTLISNVPPAPPSVKQDGMEIVEGEKLTILYEAKKCIHTRHCVTEAPDVFLANVEGPWIHPGAMDVEELAGVARECASGAIRYRRQDGQPEEMAPLVNMVRTREAGPYAFRAEIRVDGEAIGYRATLCRCGASKNKPFCDGSHHDIHFDASGEPETGDKTAMLPVRNGPLDINPLTDGPLQVRGNLEIMAGGGRMVARVTSARLCRCGGSATKPYCDGTHARIGFKST